MTNNGFTGKTALIAGGSSGIGLATAKLLSSKGANVWIIARNQERLQAALVEIEAARCNTDQHYHLRTADLTDISQTRSVTTQVIEECGGIDLLINSVGDVYPSLFQDIDIDNIRLMMEENYFSTVNVTHACLPSMLSRHSGHIVNISSVYGFLGGYGYSAYCASKYAVRGFSDSLRAELKPSGIGVSVVFPQDTATPQLEREEKMKTPVLKALNDTPVMTAESVAKAILHGIKKQRYVITPGGESKFLYALTGLLGGATYRVMDYLVSRAIKKVERDK